MPEPEAKIYKVPTPPGVIPTYFVHRKVKEEDCVQAMDELIEFLTPYVTKTKCLKQAFLPKS